jgi:metacaspase-1
VGGGQGVLWLEGDMSSQAVISGINIYKDSPYDTLRGCIEDAQQFNLLALNYLGFEPDGVTLLLDSKATAGSILLDIAKAVMQATPGDHILWTHSSHGTNEPDSSQADGLMELLCCYNTQEQYGVWDRSTVISAKQIGEVISKLHPEAHMDIILDCCYAPEGSQLRAMGLTYARTRFMPLKEVNMVGRRTVIDPKPTKMPPNVCLWSACESSQTSADAYIDGKWQGAFSAAFRKFFKVGRSRSDVMYFSRAWLKNNNYSQTPHLYGVGLASQPMV